MSVSADGIGPRSETVASHRRDDTTGEVGGPDVSASSLKIPFERGDRLIEHAPMSIGASTRAVGARPCERELQGLAAGFTFALLRRQSRPERFLTLGLSLLELNVFTLEAASHSPVF